MSELDDPEEHWGGPEGVRSIEREEIERRIGRRIARCEVLSGGRANLNLRIGEGEVFRLYLRDVSALPKEVALLQRPWRFLRVPKVLERGRDFLVLEYVPHRRLGSGATEGAAVGRALAEIHRTSFEHAGFLSGDLSVDRPFSELLEALRGHTRESLAEPGAVLGALSPAIERCLERERTVLQRHAARAVLLHGDFKVANLRWTAHGELLVLDWEFAWAGPALMDIGQLLRWSPPPPFVEAFAASYREEGGVLEDGFMRCASVFDLVNLVAISRGAVPGSRRGEELRRRVARTVERLGEAG